MKDESPFEAVKRVLGRWFDIKDPSNVAMMDLIEAVRVTSPPHREATFDTLRAILRSLHPNDGLEAWARNCAEEITSLIVKDAEICKVALAVGEGFWCTIEGTLTGMLMRATRGLDIAPKTSKPGMTREQAVEKLRALGHDAKIRDWSLGSTIWIPVGKSISTSHDVMSYRGVIYLHPKADSDKWQMTDFGYVDKSYGTLEEAVKSAHDFITLIVSLREEDLET